MKPYSKILKIAIIIVILFLAVVGYYTFRTYKINAYFDRGLFEMESIFEHSSDKELVVKTDFTKEENEEIIKYFREGNFSFSFCKYPKEDTAEIITYFFKDNQKTDLDSSSFYVYKIKDSNKHYVEFKFNETIHILNGKYIFEKE